MAVGPGGVARGLGKLRGRPGRPSGARLRPGPGSSRAALVGSRFGSPEPNRQSRLKRLSRARRIEDRDHRLAFRKRGMQSTGRQHIRLLRSGMRRFDTRPGRQARPVVAQVMVSVARQDRGGLSSEGIRSNIFSPGGMTTQGGRLPAKIATVGMEGGQVVQRAGIDREGIVSCRALRRRQGCCRRGRNCAPHPRRLPLST